MTRVRATAPSSTVRGVDQWPRVAFTGRGVPRPVAARAAWEGNSGAGRWNCRGPSGAAPSTSSKPPLTPKGRSHPRVSRTPLARCLSSVPAAARVLGGRAGSFEGARRWFWCAGSRSATPERDARAVPVRRVHLVSPCAQGMARRGCCRPHLIRTPVEWAAKTAGSERMRVGAQAGCRTWSPRMRIAGN